MILLVFAVTFHFTIHRSVTLPQPPMTRPNAGILASLSLALWISVALAGKAIAIFQQA
jgi:hypothetical protein